MSDVPQKSTVIRAEDLIPYEERFAITRAWKVGQLRRHVEHVHPYFLMAGVCTSWEAVVEKAKELRAGGWVGPIQIIPFFAIIDGDNVHEVQTTAFNPTGTPADAFRDIVTVLGEKEGSR